MGDDLVERMAAALAPYTGVRSSADAARAALAVAEPVIRDQERDRAVALVENTSSPGEADDTEVGPRYAAGYRDASNHAADALTKLARAIRTGAAP